MDALNDEQNEFDEEKSDSTWLDDSNWYVIEDHGDRKGILYQPSTLMGKSIGVFYNEG
ncbi:hypothetical protein [Fictibacillus sp. S7]|uniref:hypothetical protein n=1 Tax=Fictibacillus sp. S7 TaxID=2212476 RepID=UPI0019D70658|nr:hypothetical protein [Fictibacillus sp. S7]